MRLMPSFLLLPVYVYVLHVVRDMFTLCSRYSISLVTLSETPDTQYRDGWMSPAFAPPHRGLQPMDLHESPTGTCTMTCGDAGPDPDPLVIRASG